MTDMMRKLRIVLTVIPLSVMIIAGLLFVKSLFYNFHNDTIPIFSIIISASISLMCILIIVAIGLCNFISIKSKNIKLQLAMSGASVLLNIVFSLIWLFVHSYQFKIITAYLLITSFFFIASFLLCKHNINS